MPDQVPPRPSTLLPFDLVRIKAASTAMLRRAPGLQPMADLVACVAEIERLQKALERAEATLLQRGAP